VKLTSLLIQLACIIHMYCIQPTALPTVTDGPVAHQARHAGDIFDPSEAGISILVPLLLHDEADPGGRHVVEGLPDCVPELDEVLERPLALHNLVEREQRPLVESSFDRVQGPPSPVD
jgi:hypothetical protein